MALNLYRRHFRIAGKCAGGHAPDSRNYEAEELRRAWKKCACPIYADRTLAGQFRRRNTSQITWTEAKSIAAAWEVAGQWDDQPTAILPPPTAALPAEAPSKPIITIEFATQAYLTNRAGRHIAASTLRKYATFVKQLRAFADDKGYVAIGQFGPVGMDAFYGSWRDGVRSKAKELERLMGFFNFCVKRKWIAENPASDLEAPVGAGATANKMPLTDAELTRVYEACDRLPRSSGRTTSALEAGMATTSRR